MSKPERGTFCWHELATDAADQAREFYGVLFGWDFHTETFAGGTDYSFIYAPTGDLLGGLYEIPLSAKDGAQAPPPLAWTAYISSLDVAADLELGESLGAKTVLPMLDIQDWGRLAILQDPVGARLGLWQANRRQAAVAGREPLPTAGTFAWYELATARFSEARDFYGRLCGWEVRQPGFAGLDYLQFCHHGVPQASLLKMGEKWLRQPAHWLPYIAVENCDDAMSCAERLGARSLTRPQTVADLGRTAVLQDPQQALFAVLQKV